MRISCILLTHNRRQFVKQSLAYFLRQDYFDKELIIVDDGLDAIEDLLPANANIHYLRLESPTPIWAKRNLACRRASGEIIAHWDDADWISPNRLSIQLRDMQAAGADICGAREILYYALEAGQAWLFHPPADGPLKLASGTLMYTRQVWERRPFVEEDGLEANNLSDGLDFSRIYALDNPWYYMALHHRDNSKPCNFNDPQWQHRSIESVTERLGKDRDFYVGLRNSGSLSKADIREGYLVSCIMPTYNRQQFLPQAIRYFQRQDYPRCELIILDDSPVSSQHLIPQDSRIRYQWLPERVSIGDKRNRACEMARGEIILLWDDDDWFSPQRITYQVMPLLEGRADLSGLENSPYFHMPSGTFWKCSTALHERIFQKGVIPGTMAFWKTLWGANSRFPDTSFAEDADFLANLLRRGARLARQENLGVFFDVRHAANTWQFTPGIYLDEKEWQQVDIPNYLTRQEQDFYGLNEAHARIQHPREMQSQKRQPPTVQARPAVSACLLSYNRPNNLQPIVDSLHTVEFIEEILVWNNNPNVSLSLQGEKVRVINSDENTLCLGRYLCARQAKNDTIYTQDDDVIVNNLAELYDCFLQDPTRIAHNLSHYHYARQERSVYAGGHYALLGWGAFFRKEWIQVLDDCQQAQDDLIFRRAADRFFTVLQQKRHNTQLGDLRLFADSDNPDVALYLQPQSKFLEAQACRRVLAMIREKKSVRFPVTWNVIITCHNYARYLQEAVQSVLCNDADYVITIVDDASTDQTPEICAQLSSQYPWIKVLRHETNVEVSRASNSGISMVDSIFVVMLDADDKMGPDYLFEAEKLLRSGWDVANPDAILFGEENGRWMVPEFVNLPMLLERNNVHCCSAFRRSYWAQVGGIDEAINHWQDYEFWIRVTAAGARIRRLPGDHFFYRKHGISKDSESKWIQDQLKAYIHKKHSALFSMQELSIA